MAFFRQGGKDAEPSFRPSVSVTGRPIRKIEEVGQGPERRSRLMSAAVRQLAEHPLARRAGFPVGDGAGLESAVAAIRPLFAHEMSMARWTALRGALLYLDMLCPTDEEWTDMMPVMGLRPAAGGGEISVSVTDPSSELSADATEAAATAMSVKGDYDGPAALLPLFLGGLLYFPL
jgi:hypothetical protein